ncbi:Lrp/AsnC family transcriptional regulator [Celeribacter marinus]|uniref:Lrp/AsnC family transcriptional regulator n=1 Tax=Celeribacter marinus TaxID=1397108 RepID=UPI003F6CCF7F
MKSALDSFDRKILDLLTTDARMPITQLSVRVGLSKTPVAARIKRLEDDGIITGYRAVLSTTQLGLSHVAFVEVKLADTREKSLRDFNAAAKLVPEIAECHMIAGGYDYLLKVRTTNIEAYRAVMGQRISALPHVVSTSTYVAMETVVEQTNPPISTITS